MISDQLNKISIVVLLHGIINAEIIWDYELHFQKVLLLTLTFEMADLIL